ncbi:flavodoxin family protein [Methanoculleus sp. FWC-SCC1]|uniref:Flavodoxin family protein n=1 Tax=Methanoculleus frigidifontis TaxID=2584085 RepID=A0ABT8M9E4_9EURY|nr:flavodoxin family protein [Methanoculleus sp. FWC-SCC1]MDN7024564.1 flavodoxin family protein [Methanoculleus sp. FWC-SCC1]
MQVLGISGSPRARGNTARLLAEVLRGVSDAGGETSAVSLSDYTIAGCVGCERCRRDPVCTRWNDGMTLLYPRIVEADALVLGSPVYHYNVTSQMKAFIDRLYAFYDFTDDRPRGYSSRLADRPRKAVVFAVGEQAESGDLGIALEALSWPLQPLGYEVVGELPVLNCFEPGIVAKKEEVLAQAYRCGRELAAALSGA